MGTEAERQGPATQGGSPVRRPPELSAALLADEVEGRGLAVTWVHHAYFRTVVEGVIVGFWCARTSVVSSVAEMTSSRKDLTARLLRDAGFSVVPSRTYPADQLELGLTTAFELGVSLVVKPGRGRQGRGVTVGVDGVDELRTAWEDARAVDPRRVVVEAQVSGREIRFLVVGGRSIAAVEKRPPSVTGDGEHTIAELVGLANRSRAENRHLRAYPLELDEWRLGRLAARGLGPDSVPRAGERVRLDQKASLSEGGESIDVTDRVHPSYHELAGRVADAFPGLGVAGVDIICQRPEHQAGDDHVVVEVNSMPGLGPHHFPLIGASRDVASPIVTYTLEVAAAIGRMGAVGP